MRIEILDLLIRTSGALGLAVAVVMALRLPARRWLGPQAAYLLWAAPPLAVLGSLLPRPASIDSAPAGGGLAAWAEPMGAAGVSEAILIVWLAGVVASAAAMGVAQAAFLRQARAGRAGPAVVGVFAPRIVMPASSKDYSDDERALIWAHEREHIARGDPRAGAAAAVLTCLMWFNPLAHLGARLMRMDQELACDAATLGRLPGARRRYAETLLKTQLGAHALPFGCHWPARSPHPLAVRIGLLKARRPALGEMGWLPAAASVLAVGYAAWAVQPLAPPRAAFQWPSEPLVMLIDITPPAARVAEPGPHEPHRLQRPKGGRAQRPDQGMPARSFEGDRQTRTATGERQGMVVAQDHRNGPPGPSGVRQGRGTDAGDRPMPLSLLKVGVRAA